MGNNNLFFAQFFKQLFIKAILQKIKLSLFLIIP